MKHGPISRRLLQAASMALAAAVMLGACGSAGDSSVKNEAALAVEEHRQNGTEASTDTPTDRAADASAEVSAEEAALETTKETAGKEADKASEEVSTDISAPEEVLVLTVVSGEYFTTILSDLSELGFGDAETLLEAVDMSAETLPGTSVFVQSLDADSTDLRTFAAEGYVAPGDYSLSVDATPEEVWTVLLTSWDEYWDDAKREQAAARGLTPDQVMILASIVERESEKDPYDKVKPQVAAVIANRLEQNINLEMDVTVFYLQEALVPYLDAEDYEAWYDTYETAIPAGPIGSPSPSAVEAMLNPADTNDLFFIYDKEGNYYFSEDYETHLSYCAQYLD